MGCPKALVENIGLSEEDKFPCELCSIIEDLKIIVGEAAKEVKQSELVKTYERMKKEYRKLLKTHRKCPGCGLCFGGFHLAFPHYEKGIGNVCQWCAKDIADNGIEKFKEKLKKGVKQ